MDDQDTRPGMVMPTELRSTFEAYRALFPPVLPEHRAEPDTLTDTILLDERARIAVRIKQEAEHHARRAHVLDALRGAVAPGADPGPVNALATALSVQPAALGDVLRELLR